MSKSKSGIQTLIENYSKRRGISKEKAIEELRQHGFNFEPEGSSAEGPVELAEGEGEGPPSPLSTTLNETAKNFGAVAAIGGLKKVIEAGSSGMPSLTDMWAYREYRRMMREDDREDGDGGGRGQGLTLQDIQAMNEQTKNEILEEIDRREKGRLQEENERLRRTEEERLRKEERKADLQPLYDAQTKMQETLQKLAEQVAAAKTPQEKSEAVQVAETLGNQIKQAIEKLGTPTTPEKKGALDELKQALDIVETVEKRVKGSGGGEGSGVPDWKTLAISEIGETGRAFLAEWRKIQEKAGTSPEGGQLSEEQLAEIKVGAYLANLLKGGAAEMNVYEAAKTLNLSAEQVMKAVTSLKTKNQINFTTPPPASSDTKTPPPGPGVQEA